VHLLIFKYKYSQVPKEKCPIEDVLMEIVMAQMITAVNANFWGLRSHQEVVASDSEFWEGVRKQNRQTWAVTSTQTLEASCRRKRSRH